MDSGNYTDLISTLLLSLFLVLIFLVLARALIRWRQARKLWRAVIARENLPASSDRIWSRVKVRSTNESNRFRRWLTGVKYGLIYVDGDLIRVETISPIDNQLLVNFDRSDAASCWRNDWVELRSGDNGLQFKAIDAGLPLSSVKRTDAFWQDLQPTHAEPFENGYRRFNTVADHRSKTALLMLAIVGLVAMLEIVFLNPYWLIAPGAFAKFGLIPVFAALLLCMRMMNDDVPFVEAGSATLMFAVSLSVASYIGVKRVDQWFSDPAQVTYMLAHRGDRELVPVDSSEPVIKLTLASAVWNDVPLGSQHPVTIRGGLFGTSQVNYAQLLPAPR